MIKSLKKVYEIFKQIELMNGTVGWDQTLSFNYFYENKNYLVCWQLLYSLFTENKTLTPSKLGVVENLTQIRKLSEGKSILYRYDITKFEFVVVAIIERNGKHQPNGNTFVMGKTKQKNIEFVDGEKIDENIVDKKSEQLIEWEKTYLLNGDNLSLNWVESLGGDIEWLQNLSMLLQRKGVDYSFFEIYLINVDKLTSEEIKDLSYVEDRLDVHLGNDGLGNYTETPTDEELKNEIITDLYEEFQSEINSNITGFILSSSKTINLNSSKSDLIEFIRDRIENGYMFDNEDTGLKTYFLGDIYYNDSSDKLIYADSIYFTKNGFTDNLINIGTDFLTEYSLKDNVVICEKAGEVEDRISIGGLSYIKTDLENDDLDIVTLNGFNAYFRHLDSNKIITEDMMIKYLDNIASDYQLDVNDENFMGFLNTNPLDSGEFTDTAIELISNLSKWNYLMLERNLKFESTPNEEEAIFEFISMIPKKSKNNNIQDILKFL